MKSFQEEKPEILYLVLYMIVYQSVLILRKLLCPKRFLITCLCDHIDAYILVKGSISVGNTREARATTNNKDKKIIFKNCAPFTDCISEINNTQIDDTKDIDVVMSIYSLIKYSDNYSKIFESLW